jgi:hypothetical protein
MYRRHGRRDILSLAARWRLVVPLEMPEIRNKPLYLQHPVFLLKITNHLINKQTLWSRALLYKVVKIFPASYKT